MPPFDTPYSRTDLTKKDKIFRLLHRIEGRLSYFEDQINYRASSPYFPEYWEKLNDFKLKALRSILLLKGVGNNYNYNKTLGDMSKPTLRQRVKRADDFRHRYNQIYDWVKDWPDREAHLSAYFNISIPDTWHKEKNHRWLCKRLIDGAFTTSTQVLKSKLLIQIEEAYQNKWYVVFATLTVDNVHEELVFSKGSNAWRNYIRRVQYAVEASTYGSHRKAKDKPPCFHYFSVVEEGTEGPGRLHLHALMFMKTNPNLLDPNFGLRVPYKREIPELEYFWPYGYAQCIAVRFSQNDAWGSEGWAWPVQKNGQPVDETNFIKIVQYLLKYILKSKQNHKEIPWRTKTSGKLGKLQLQQTLSRMKTSRVYALCLMTVYPTKIKLHGINCPTRFIRDAAVGELITRSRKWKKNLKASKPDTRLKTLLRSSTLKRHDLRWRNSGDILAELLSGRDISSFYIHDCWRNAKNEIESAFPAVIDYHVSGGITSGL